MYEKDLLIPYALRDGQLVHIDQLTEADRGLKCKCVCPNEACGKPLVARMGKVRTHYFAHAHQVVNCSEMTVLHAVAQRLLFERIQAALNEGRPIQASWRCSTCYGEHKGNILRGAVRVEMEKAMISEGARAKPDISLYGEDNRLLKALEVIVTHAPEEQTAALYDKEKVIRVDFRLQDFADLSKIIGESLAPDRVTWCPTPPPPPPEMPPSVGACPKCGEGLYGRDIALVETHCWTTHCGSTMLLAMGRVGLCQLAPRDFKNEEIRYAQGLGAKFIKQYNGLSKQYEYYNLCPACNIVWGNQYLPFPRDLNDLPVSFSILADCDFCDQVRSNPKRKLLTCQKL